MSAAIAPGVRPERVRWSVRLAALAAVGLALLTAGEVVARLAEPPGSGSPREAAPRAHLNALEFHDVDHAIAKPAGVRRVLCLGDSFTFARGIPIDRNYCALLAPLLAERGAGGGIEPISYAHEGYSTAHEVRMLENKGGLDLDPDLIVLGYVLNDPEDEWHPLKLDALREPTLRREPSGVWGVLTRASALARLAFERVENTRRYHALVDYYRALHADDYQGWRQCRDAFARLGAISRDRHVPVVVAIFPLLDFPLGARYPFAELHAKVATLARESGLGVLDLLPVLAPHAGPELLLVPGADPHPSARAHRLVAEALAGELAARGWLGSASGDH